MNLNGDIIVKVEDYQLMQQYLMKNGYAVNIVPHSLNEVRLIITSKDGYKGDSHGI